MKLNFEKLLKLLGNEEIDNITTFLNSNNNIFKTKKFTFIITQMNDAFDGFKG